MDPHDFLDVADELSRGTREADWRSAVSRAYYAAFHVARSLLVEQGFQVPQADRAPAYLWMRLSNSGHPDLQQAGINLNHLRGQRNWAVTGGRTGPDPLRSTLRSVTSGHGIRRRPPALRCGLRCASGYFITSPRTDGTRAARKPR
jgi:hypothetical protein